MRKAIAIGLLATATAACGETRSESAGPTVQKSFTVGDFRKMEVAGSYDVQVRTGSAASVSASGPQKMIERMVVEVKGDKLLIHPEKRKGFNFGWSRDKPVQVTVTVPALHGAAIAGSGAISVDRVQADAFDGEIAGSGDLRLGAVQVQRLAMTIAGSGEARVQSGQVRDAEYEIAGSGDIDAQGIRSETAKVSIAGSGNVRANASKTATVDIAGSGDVEVTGGAQCKVSKAGSGDVRCS